MKRFFIYFIGLLFFQIFSVINVFGLVVSENNLIFDKSTQRCEGDYNYLDFSIFLESSGTYKIKCLMSAAELDSIGSYNFIEYAIMINGKAINGIFKPQKQGWHDVMLVDKLGQPLSVNLNQGLNIVTFYAKNPIIPEISSVLLSDIISRNIINLDDNYLEYIDNIKSKKTNIYSVSSSQSYNNTGVNNIGTILDNPCGTYYHHLDVDVNYTTVKCYQFNEGDIVGFASYSNGVFPFVMDVFYLENPEINSWSVKSNSSGAAILNNITIRHSGLYLLCLRSINNGIGGLVNLQVFTPDRNYNYAQCPISTLQFEYPHSSNIEYNYFTTNARNVDPSLLVESIGVPGRILGYNQYYFNDDGTDWGFDARIKKQFSMPVKSIHVFSENPMHPTGKCDIYIKCPTFNNSTLLNGAYFPLLNQNDAIESAPATGPRRFGGYNCFAWAGGVTTEFVYPEVPDTDSEAFLDSLDAFYANPNRYAGAMVYSREGATEENSVIDLWYNPVAWNGVGAYTHASVRGRANNHPHGYAWESKLGEYERIFHPRYALSGDTINNGYSYGYIKYHYRQVEPSAVYISLEQSVAENKTIIEDVILSSADLSKIDNLLNLLSSQTLLDFDNEYNQLVSSLRSPQYRMQSNPRFFVYSREYQDFICYCNRQGTKIWPFLYKKVNEGDIYALNLIRDIIVPKNKEIFSDIKINYSTTKNKEGLVIYRPYHSKIMRLVKTLLNDNIVRYTDDDVVYSNSVNFSVNNNQIEFNIINDSYVDIVVYDLNRNLISNPLRSEYLNKGLYKYDLKIPLTNSKPCIVVLTVNGIMNSKIIKL